MEDLPARSGQISIVNRRIPMAVAPNHGVDRNPTEEKRLHERTTPAVAADGD